MRGRYATSGATLKRASVCPLFFTASPIGTMKRSFGPFRLTLASNGTVATWFPATSTALDVMVISSPACAGASVLVDFASAGPFFMGAIVTGGSIRAGSTTGDGVAAQDAKKRSTSRIAQSVASIFEIVEGRAPYLRRKIMRDIERRIRRAVFFALASGCHPQETPSVEVPPAPSGTVIPLATATVDAAPAPPVEVALDPNDPPQKICTTLYKNLASSPNDPHKRVPTTTRMVSGPQPGPVDGVGRAIHSSAQIQCQFHWGSEQFPFTYTYAPTCCPTPHPSPCPPPSTVTAQATRIKVQWITLEASTLKTQSERFEWQVIDPSPPRHMCGRRPEGAIASRDANDTGARLALMAELEAASVFAFARLARELAAHGAPSSLVDRAHDAREDEIRHTRATTALARAYGGEPHMSDEASLEVRDLFSIALENVVEGCVYETLGAAIATFQSQRARDACVRDAFVEIAREECLHAALAADVHAWIEPRLTNEERHALEDARARAIASLAQREIAVDDTLGLPNAEEDRAIVATLFS